jgi:hypothetical protein
MTKAPDLDYFKGYPVIIIYTGRVYKDEEEKITMGYRKARAVCDNIDHLRRFVEKCEVTGEDK